MTTNKKLEIFRKIYCLGDLDIKKIFPDNYENYFKYKYEEYRSNYGAYGNFHLLFQLDEDNAKKFLDYVGFEDIPNSKHYTLEEQ
jgi:hypothetical protein